MLRILMLLAVISSLVACASKPQLTAEIDAFSAPVLKIVDSKIAIKAEEGMKADSLQYTLFRNKLSERLTKQQFQVVDSKHDHDFIAYFSYAIDEGELVVEEYEKSTVTPRVGFGIGSYGPRTYTGFTYRIGTSENYTKTYMLYRRQIAVTITSPDGLERIYEATIKSAGTCGRLSAVFDVMLDALFMEFPSGSGKVTVPMDQACD